MMAMQTLVTNQSKGLRSEKNIDRSKWNRSRYGLFKTTPFLMEKIRKEIMGSSNNQASMASSARFNNNLPRMLDLMNVEVCKINPKVKVFSVENDSWKTNISAKPAFDQRTFVYAGSELYFAGYPYSEEIVRADLKEQQFEALKGYKFFEANEGTMIRVFNIENTWYTSTNKKLDAFVSKWASKKKTFGMQVAEAVQVLITNGLQPEDTGSVDQLCEKARVYLNTIWENNLQKDKKYFFLLRPCGEEKLVCDTNSNRLINIGVLDANNNLSMDEDVILKNVDMRTEIVVPRPTERSFGSLEDFVQQLDSLDPFTSPGFIAIGKGELATSAQPSDGTNVHVVKIVSNKYKYLSLLRNNVPSLNFRYLQLEHLRTMEFIHDPNGVAARKANSILQDFLNLYHHVFDPKPIRLYIWSVVVNDLFEKYQQIYIKHTHLDLLPKTASVLSLIHNEYVESRFSQKTDRKRIADILACIKPTLLNQLIREYQEKERKAMLKQTKEHTTLLSSPHSASAAVSSLHSASAAVSSPHSASTELE